MRKPTSKRRLPVLNGLSIDSIEISQDGEIRVSFDLPIDQTTPAYQRELQGVRTLDVYEHPHLQELCRDLFRALREEVMKPDPDRVDVHCDRCKTSDCCRKYNVLVTDADIDLLAEGLGLSRQSLRRKYLTAAVDWCEDYRHQLICDEDESGEKCVFLKKTAEGQYRCSIYEFRPQICRDFDMNTCNDFVPLERIESI